MNGPRGAVINVGGAPLRAEALALNCDGWQKSLAPTHAYGYAVASDGCAFAAPFFIASGLVGRIFAGHHVMSLLVYFTPVWFVLEVVQLIVSERFLGVTQIKADADPRQLGPGERPAFVWTAGILSYWIWMVAMLFQSTGRAAVVAMIVITLIGFFIRRNCTIKWILVALTFEGALRIGMLLYLGAFIWRQI